MMSKPTKGVLLIERASPAGAHEGLCLTCVQEPGCTFRRFAGQPIRQCEEWIGESPLATAGPARSDATRPVTAGHAGRDGRIQPRMTGLCASCERYPTCAYAKTEGGVWHCEDYL